VAPQNDSGLGEKLVVRRGRVDSVDLFEIKENELDLLEQGSPATLQLNFAIFLLSLAFSAIVTLTTVDLPQGVIRTIYVVIAVVGVLLGGYLLLMWWRTRQSIDEIVAKIRKRMPPEALEPVPTKTSSRAGGDTTTPAG
jgi:hypothetical protein